MQKLAMLLLVGVTSATVFHIANRGAVVDASQAQAKASAPAPFDPCALLTKQEAAAAVGEAVKESSGAAGRSIMPGTTASSCEYMSATSINRVRLNVWRASADGAGMLQQTYQMACAKKGKEGLSGFGDVACWYDAKHEELQVLRGATAVVVQLRRSGDATEPIKTVAKKALERLP